MNAAPSSRFSVLSKTSRPGIRVRDTLLRTGIWQLRTAPALLLQRVRQKIHRAFPGISSVFGAVSLFVVGIFKAVTCVGIDMDVRFLAEFVERIAKFFHVVGSDAAILAAKEPENWCIDFLQLRWIGHEWAVVDHRRG